MKSCAVTDIEKIGAVYNIVYSTYCIQFIQINVAPIVKMLLHTDICTILRISIEFD